MSVELRPVTTLLGRHRFVAVPFTLFGDDQEWIPPLRLSVLDRISPKNPANSHQVTALWIAYRDGRPVGRIGACVDTIFNEFQHVAWGWVGFFEAADDGEVVKLLFDAARAWLKSRGATTAVGPASFTTNDEAGLLVEGFEDPPVVLDTHNPPYYERLWLDNGWEQVMDLWAWRFVRSTIALSDRQRKVLDRLRARARVAIRPVNMKDFNAEVSRLFKVYNSAWSANWGFAPMPEAEVRHLAKQLKPMVDPNLVLLAEKADGEPVGVSIVLPDVNEVLARIRSGRLLPTGWYHLLRGLPKVTRVRVFAVGVKPDQQNLGLGPLLYQEGMQGVMRRPEVVSAEASWVLANNDPMNKALAAMGGTRSKTWRMYQQAL
jgi:ribosomal protein S18 acetylase RimI-like enzyme